MKTRRYIIIAAALAAAALAVLAIFGVNAYSDTERRSIDEYFYYLYGRENIFNSLDDKDKLLIEKSADDGGEAYRVVRSLIPWQRPSVHKEFDTTLELVSDKREYAPGETIYIELRNNTQQDVEFFDLKMDIDLGGTWYTVFPGFGEDIFVCKSGETLSFVLSPDILRVFPRDAEDGVILWPGKYRVTVHKYTRVTGPNTLCREFTVTEVGA